MTTNKVWHSLASSEVFSNLKTSREGLEKKEALSRLDFFGLNEIPVINERGFFRIFLRQFSNPFQYVLILAAIFFAVLGNYLDAGVIFGVSVLNVFLGAMSEWQALGKLKLIDSENEKEVLVFREGREVFINEKLVVPGDVLILDRGDFVAADAHLFLANRLMMNEAVLTGEGSLVAKKSDDILPFEEPLASRVNMVYKGTYVGNGYARAVVVETGLQTEIGRLGTLAERDEVRLPLVRGVDFLARSLLFFGGLLVFLILIFLWANGRDMNEGIFLAITLAITLVPEGLPLISSLFLVGGLQKLYEADFLIKKNAAVEALGEVTVLALDKTGTVTKNEMVVQKIFVNNRFFEVSGDGYNNEGKFHWGEREINPEHFPDLRLMGYAAELCANGEVLGRRVVGDPTEVALRVFGEKLGFDKNILEREHELVLDEPVSENQKYHLTVHREGDGFITTALGASEEVMSLCKKIYWHGEEVDLESDLHGGLTKTLEKNFLSLGMRVIAVAYMRSEVLPSGKPFSSAQGKKNNNLVLLGFIGMTDELRLNIKKLIVEAKQLGVRSILITGDHKLTALAVAERIGLVGKRAEALTDLEINKMNDVKLASVVLDCAVFARVSPQNKLRIINALRARGEVVAMTGDGVNDAPSLADADLGIAMAGVSSAVASEVADALILSNDFLVMVEAMKVGRLVFQKIKKLTEFVLSIGFSEAFFVSLGIFLGSKVVLLPIQAVWLNVVSDLFLVMVFWRDNNLENIREREMFNGAFWKKVLGLGLLIGITTFGVGNFFEGLAVGRGMTAALVFLSLMQVVSLINIKLGKRLIEDLKIYEWRELLAGVLGMAFMLMLVVYFEPMRLLLRTVSLGFKDWLLLISFAMLLFILMELRKRLRFLN